MAKHPRKKQKTSQHKEQAGLVSNKAARLELLMDEESKDDEERRLESLLFGIKYVPKEKGKGKMPASDDEDDDEDMEDFDDEGARGMQHLQDQDLFFVDEGLPEAPVTTSKRSLGHSGSDTSDSESGSESDSGSQSSSSTSSHKYISSSKKLPKSLTASKSKRPAWVDPADTEATARVSLLSGPTRLRKLRQAVDEDEITGRDYETRLRSQYERINPEPAWAKKARGKKTKVDSDDEGEGDEGRLDQEGEGVAELLASTTGILADVKRKGRKTVVLPQGTLALERVRDANHSVQSSSSGEVRTLAFHPKPAVPVLCVGTGDRRIRLFNIDGHLSPLLTTLHTPSLPLVSSTSVLFHPEGNSLLISGPRPFFYTYDLQQGTSTLHRRGLWGTGFDDTSFLSSGSGPTNNSKRRRKGAETTGGGGKGGGGNTETVLHTAFSPSTGSMLAVAGRGGNVHIVDWKSGAGQVIASLKCSSSGGGGGGGVQGLCWVPSSSEGEGVLGGGDGNGSGVNDERHLAVLTGDAEVYIWDVAQRRCVKRWKDEGGYRGAGRVFATGGGVNGSMAIGSSSGFVNVYGSDSFSVPQNHNSADAAAAMEKPKLVKALGQLTTPISTLRFNHDAQILAMASKEKKDSMRLIHLPSLTAFGNWPTSSTPLGHVTAVDFSARSEYVAIGNTRGRVLLYHLKEYGSGSGAGGFGVL